MQAKAAFVSFIAHLFIIHTPRELFGIVYQIRFVMLRPFVLFFFTAFAITLPAQSQLDSMQHIPEVLVQAEYIREVLKPQRLSGKLLEGLSTHSVADAIRYFSGVQIKDYGGVGGVKTVNIRSMGSHHVGVFYDGIQLGNAQNGQIDLGKYSLDNMEMVSVYAGQKSDLFQSARDFSTSGSIYLRTRRPRFEPTKNYNLTATFRTGSFGLANPSILWEQKLSKRVNLSLNAESVNATGKYKYRDKKRLPSGGIAYDTTAVRHNGDIRSIRAEAAIFGTLQTGGWDTKLYFYDSERGIPGAVVNNVYKRGERQWDRSFFTQGAFRKAFSDNRYRLKVSGKYAHDYTRFLRDDPKELPLDNTYRQQEGYLSAVQMYSVFNWWELSLAADFQWNTLDANLKEFASPTRYTEMIVLASRLTLDKLSVQGNLLSTLVQEKVSARKQSAASPNRHIWSPALFVSYKPLSQADWRIQAFYKHCFRMPTFNDLYYTEIGNAYLDPETARQYNLGSSYEKQFSSGWLRMVRIQADAYYNEVKNKIIAYPKGGQFRWTMLNLGTVKIKGVEVNPQAIICLGSLNATLQLNYTWQQARDYTDPTEGYYKDQIPYIPLHSGSVISMFEWKQWQLNYSFIYVGERYKRSANLPEFHVQPWYTNDVSVSRRLQTGKLRWQLTGEVNNLLNQQYEVVENYPMPGINFKLTIRLMI